MVYIFAVAFLFVGPQLLPATTPVAVDVDGRPQPRDHWAWSLVESPTPPPVADEDWVQGAIDHFVLARLESQGLVPSPAADKRTLIRRAYLDLVGLPPTYDEVEAFVRDDSSDAFTDVVDHLLSLPQYGECWGRHWLDLARYSDGDPTPIMPETGAAYYAFSYTYRDYVIRALNADTPYDQFILEQLAADQLDLDNEPWRLAGLGFLTLGVRLRTDGKNRPDVIDDQIDTLSRGLLGLSVSCARCHNHKYDPIPTEDYYSLYGVFASCDRAEIPPLIGKSSEPADRADMYRRSVENMLRVVQNYENESYVDLMYHLRSQVKDYLVAVVAGDDDQGLEKSVYGIRFRPGEIRFPITWAWRKYIDEAEAREDPVFTPWHALSKLTPDEFASGAGAIIEQFKEAAEKQSGQRPNRKVVKALVEHPPESMRDVASVYGELLQRIYEKWLRFRAVSMPIEGHIGGSSVAVSALPNSDEEQLRQLLYGDETPTDMTVAEARIYFHRVRRAEGKKLRGHLYETLAQGTSPPRAMAVDEFAKPYDPVVFLRGDRHRPGKPVPRQFLKILSPPERQPFQNGSGRLELAQAVASEENPLTARVLVNRVWMHHFGRGIVATPSDFGVRGDPPSHPLLLDFLARQFMDDGWSLKRLHRRILLSATYQQASLDRPACVAEDPVNDLLWKMRRRRLPLEPMRDSLLAVAGLLDGTSNGRPEEIDASHRRTVFCFVDRGNLNPMQATFDFASPLASCPQRVETTVPQQALFFLNSPLVLTYAEGVLRAAGVEGLASMEDRVQALYRQIFARDATAEEFSLAAAYLAQELPNGSDPNSVDPNSASTAGFPADEWTRYAQALLLSNEFLFVD